MRNNKIIIFLLITFTWSWVNWAIALHDLKNGATQTGTNYFISFFFIGAFWQLYACLTY